MCVHSIKYKLLKILTLTEEEKFDGRLHTDILQGKEPHEYLGHFENQTAMSLRSNLFPYLSISLSLPPSLPPLSSPSLSPLCMRVFVF